MQYLSEGGSCESPFVVSADAAQTPCALASRGPEEPAGEANKSFAFIDPRGQTVAL